MVIAGQLDPVHPQDIVHLKILIERPHAAEEVVLQFTRPLEQVTNTCILIPT